MARPRKFRKVCHFPRTLTFLPEGEQTTDNPVTLSIDEYETLRLIDKEGKSQEECSISMKVARTTVQSIYMMARKKVADAIVDGRPLIIAGGDYDLCNGRVEYCPRKDCFKKLLHGRYQKKKEEYVRVAIPRKSEQIAKDFMDAEEFILIDFWKKQKEEIQYIKTEEKKRASFSVDAVLCNGIDEASRKALEEVDVRYYSGISLETEEIFTELLGKWKLKNHRFV